MNTKKRQHLKWSVGFVVFIDNEIHHLQVYGLKRTEISAACPYSIYIYILQYSLYNNAIITTNTEKYQVVLI